MFADDTATSTRIFISGLPPKFTSNDLRQHFAQKSQVTDAHVFSDRRIAFVGFQDHESAQNAVKYFNKSFIRMSKIAVSLAKPVDVKRDASGQAAPISQKREKAQQQAEWQASKKRKREAKDDGEKQRTLQTSTQDDSVPRGEAADAQSGEGEDEFQGFDSDPAEKAETDAHTDHPVSDTDWLRGKTNRTLDLQDPEKDIVISAPVQQLPSPVSPQPSQKQVQEPAEDVERLETSPDDVSAVPNGRLFVRNLAFGVEQDDLRSLFAPYGSLAEVCLLCYFFLPFCDDFSIGTSYAIACDSTREPVF